MSATSPRRQPRPRSERHGLAGADRRQRAGRRTEVVNRVRHDRGVVPALFPATARTDTVSIWSHGRSRRDAACGGPRLPGTEASWSGLVGLHIRAAAKNVEAGRSSREDVGVAGRPPLGPRRDQGGRPCTSPSSWGRTAPTRRLGAPLACRECQIAFASLIRRFPHLRLGVAQEELRWRHGLVVRVVCDLPVVLGR
jgi:hypothetical protein